uniref:Uncharacterized protein n=1 Tax=Strongyloides stercoralis TaxID=6248 RepID=A0AAF5I3M8_STRER
MNYLFILVVALALITENGILAGTVSQSSSCDNSGCVVICKVDGKVVSCHDLLFKDTIYTPLCNVEECSKECKKKSKRGVCKSLFNEKEKKVIQDECICK